MILTLDLATRTGWCRGEPGGPVTVGTARLPKTGNDVGSFLNAFEHWLEGALDGIEYVVFESPIIRSSQLNIAVMRKLYALAGVTEMVAKKRGLIVLEERIQTVKKQLAGHGRADKEQMVAAARARGVPVTDDNQADAFGLFLCAVARDRPDLLVAYEPNSLLGHDSGALDHVVMTIEAVRTPAPQTHGDSNGAYAHAS